MCQARLANFLFNPQVLPPVYRSANRSSEKLGRFRCWAMGEQRFEPLSDSKGHVLSFCFFVGFFFEDFIYLFLERGKGRKKKEREALVSCLSYASHPGTEPASALTGN